MRELRWSFLKSERLKRTRGVSFEEIIHARLVAVKEHPSRPHQRIMLFDYKGYLWVVPCAEQSDEIFLKTLYPSRQYTQRYRRGEVS